MSQQNGKRAAMVIAAFVWIFIAVLLGVAYKFMIEPAMQAEQQAAQEQQQEQTLTATSSESRYRHTVDISLDSFSGYAVLRSDEFRDELSRKRIRLNLRDDQADYSTRFKQLASGETPMAVITVDALIKQSAVTGSLPVTIVAVVDETRGADAMVAYQQAVPNIDALNAADVKFVLTPDSPSETLARVVMSQFQLDNLSTDPFIRCESAVEVYDRYRKASMDEPQVFVMWEPYVSRMLDNPNTHIVVDSSRFRGYIVDVLVANRDWLVKNRELASNVVEAYLRASYAYNGDMLNLVLEDARKQGEPLNEKQAKRLVDGVWWKNTSENWAHFGIEDANLQHIEDIIVNLTRMLTTSGVIQSDPTNGQPNLLYYDGILRKLKESGFYPGVENVRDDSIVLPALTDSEWEKLRPLGSLNVPKLVFARGTSRLTSSSLVHLDVLIEQLESWPTYYVKVQGNASKRGNVEANRKLALARAEAAAKYLIDRGVVANRVKAMVGDRAQSSVVFVLGQPPF